MAKSLTYFQGAIGLGAEAPQPDPTFDTLFVFVSGSSHLPRSRKQSSGQQKASKAYLRVLDGSPEDLVAKLSGQQLFAFFMGPAYAELISYQGV